MISVDLTKIKRFKKLKDSAIQKILHPTEIIEFNKLSKDTKPIYLATRWSLKECIFKVDNNFFEFRKILIKKNESGKYIFNDFQLSTTNEDGYIVAVAFKS